MSTGAEDERTVTIAVAEPTSPPVEHGVSELEKALAGRGLRPVRTSSRQATREPAFLVARPGMHAEPESFCIRRVDSEDAPTFQIAGTDERGLMYALLEIARAIELAQHDLDPLEVIEETTESPALSRRSLAMFLFNRDLEDEWYYEEDFWRGCFSMLARNRYNGFSLIFSHQTSYLAPVYPFLVKHDQFPQVSVPGLTDSQRERNLHALRFISQLAGDMGIDFALGVWQQHAHTYGPNMVEGLTPDLLRDYCAAALKLVLQECSAIRGVQFRMNIEAGIDEDGQQEYWAAQFRAARDCGRPVRLDIRAKGLRDETIRDALEACPDTTVSTKFWCEHLGLPYHMTDIQERDRHIRRYSFADLLRNPRPYELVYRLWSVGSQRVLLWADPAYARRFAHSCRFGGATGFEVMAPLTNKGFGNEPGKWRIFADATYEHYPYEYERYWFFYLAFGRLGYNPDSRPEIWRRELRSRFGAAAPHLEQAYREASQIIPFLTAVHLPSASCWGYWPEMETGGAIADYVRTEPSDTAQFYGIEEYVQDAVQGRLHGKWTPARISRHFRELSERTLAAVDEACRTQQGCEGAELKSTVLDLRVLAYLARYHAEKVLAGMHLAFFRARGQTRRLPLALDHAQQAAAAWQRTVELTDSVYHSDLVFGRDDFWHRGHWKDRLPAVQEDVKCIEALLESSPPDAEAEPLRTYPGEQTEALAALEVRHEAATEAEEGEDLRLVAEIKCDAALRKVCLHYRPVNQMMKWESADMEPAGGHWYEATVPGRQVAAEWNLAYYFEMIWEDGGQLWPSWQEGQPYFVVYVRPCVS